MVLKLWQRYNDSFGKFRNFKRKHWDSSETLCNWKPNLKPLIRWTYIEKFLNLDENLEILTNILRCFDTSHSVYQKKVKLLKSNEAQKF